MIKIDVQGAYAFCIEPQLLTVGMVGAEVAFSFDEPWETLTKCAVFTVENALRLSVRLLCLCNRLQDTCVYC